MSPRHELQHASELLADLEASLARLKVLALLGENLAGKNALKKVCEPAPSALAQHLFNLKATRRRNADAPLQPATIGEAENGVHGTLARLRTIFSTDEIQG